MWGGGEARWGEGSVEWWGVESVLEEGPGEERCYEEGGKQRQFPE